MKYKLINSVTKTETICRKVTIDGFDYYMTNEKASEINQWVVDTEYYPDCIVYKTDEKYFEIGKEENICIATNNPNIDIPKVVDEIERLAESIIPNLRYKKYVKTGFIGGYKKSQETHSNSDEDMVEFTEWLVKRLEPKYDCDTTMNFIPQVMIHGEEQVWIKGNEMITRFYTTKELLQLWKEQQPKIVYYE